MHSVTGSEDQVVTLADGRQLGYTEYGDPAGAPLINCHGGLSCRLDVAPAGEAARAAGIRLLSPDRPGIGLSTRQPGRRIGAWADDVAALADHLDLDTFRVLGWSFGGPYAAAVAALLPERTVAATIVAGGVPLSWPCASGGFENRTDALFSRLSRRFSPLAKVGLRATGGLAAVAPNLWLRGAAAGMTSHDVEVIERSGTAQFARSIAEGLRRPGGAVDDYQAYERPWGFEYESITVPVHLWQGQDDTFVPVAWSEEAARRIPGATLTVVPGCGHFVAYDHWEEIFSELLGHG